ncbi:MAG TPA: penicillin-binding protein 2 [Candidatus Saccharimonadales bacterium]|nr:penicillin-binding protein 2 [Candidatus Saccharimonadales bacterium]
MIVFDQLRKNDPQLRVLTLGVLCGLSILLAGLWSVQVFSHRKYSENQMSQSYRTVRIPAIRGKILDRNGVPLAENQPSYNLNIYLDELRDRFQSEWKRTAPKGRLTRAQRNLLEPQSRYRVVSNIVTRIGNVVQQPLNLDEFQFLKHYSNSLALPMPVLIRLTPDQIARYQEEMGNAQGLDLEIQPARLYPRKRTAAHILGYLLRDDSSAEDEESFFNFRLPDYRGRVGIEGAYDQELRGKAGMKSVLVNSLGFRQSENVWTPAEPGKNVVLTIDADIQAAAEAALQTAGVLVRPLRGAVVVMDPNTGDILAMVSAPTYDPNVFIPRISREDYQPLTDETLRPQSNRATHENYSPGSIFKIVVGMACLEAGLNPDDRFYVPADPRNPSHGYIMVGKRAIKDTAPAGDYDFRRAFMRSSNYYFITNGLRYGIDGILTLGQRLHFGEKTGIPTMQEVGGSFPTYKSVRRGWSDGDTANLCIGQGPVDITPLQIAVLISAIANGGKVMWPRIVDHIEPQDFMGEENITRFERGRVRDNLGVSKRTLDIVRNAMRSDVEDAEGTGKAASIEGFRVCAKTGTAQVMNSKREITDHTTWFASYGPYEAPRYVVVVMAESGVSGGGTCGPVAKLVYQAILDKEKKLATKGAVLAQKE